jgi:hypothetical protein
MEDEDFPDVWDEDDEDEFFYGVDGFRDYSDMTFDRDRDD